VGSLTTLPDKISTVTTLENMDDAIVFEQEAGYLLLDGVIGSSTAHSFAVADLANTTILELDSEGGLIDSAIEIARLVHQHNIVTFVQGECLSACVLIAVRGYKLVAIPHAIFGFHQGASLSELDSSFARFQSQEATALMFDELKKSGVPDKVLQAMLETNKDKMTYYTGRELYEAGVIDKLL